MPAEQKPATRPIWSEAGAIVEPSNGKKALGWIEEVPPHEYFNWVLNNLSQFAAHVNESGMPEWDSLTSYDIDGYCKGSDGTLYRSTVNGNVNNDPSTVAGKNFWRNAVIGKFTGQSSVRVSGFAPFDLNDINLLLANSPGPYYLTQGTFTNPELTVIRDDILNQWTTEVETP